MHLKAAVGNARKSMGSGIVPDLKAAVVAHVADEQDALNEATAAWTLALKTIEMADVNEVQS